MLVRSVPGSRFFFYPKVVKGTVVRIRIRGRIVHVDVERTRIRAVIEIRKANRSTPAETTVASGTKPQIKYRIRRPYRPRLKDNYPGNFLGTMPEEKWQQKAP